MKVLLFALIAVGGLVWWLGGRRVALLLGVPKSWTTRRGQIIFAVIILGSALAITSLPYLQ
ncbi:MAG: hypothetical protein HOK30_03840 [Rhodospirillaceae bacterium]|nr:hypothetical protein [Rhodospirillaceae bacterium]MBT4490884.1 hypothetical protein [Rhodospirillaceae bacterium]MBT5190743.1 hypothetical protein [Rhodospirillaceae bacterium]MBT5897701.1 hypothetical protein [Rhodospirillaceae bacterium]MBT6426769.1 hypothetical protein [Rhodospirillaceae bacterium]